MELIWYPVVEPWDGLVGAAAVASSFPLGVIFGEKLRFFWFIFLFALLVFAGEKHNIKTNLNINYPAKEHSY